MYKLVVGMTILNGYRSSMLRTHQGAVQSSDSLGLFYPPLLHVVKYQLSVQRPENPNGL